MSHSLIKREVIIKIGENNKILDAEIYDVSPNNNLKVPVEMNCVEVLHYLFDFCDGMELLIKYDEEMENMTRKEAAENRFKFELFVMSICHEVFEQERLNPLFGFKLFLATPLFKVLDFLCYISDNTRFALFAENSIGSMFRKALLTFLFGKENALQIEQLIREGKEKYSIN